MSLFSEVRSSYKCSNSWTVKLQMVGSNCLSFGASSCILSSIFFKACETLGRLLGRRGGHTPGVVILLHSVIFPIPSLLTDQLSPHRRPLMTQLLISLSLPFACTCILAGFELSSVTFKQFYCPRLPSVFNLQPDLLCLHQRLASLSSLCSQAIEYLNQMYWFHSLWPLTYFLTHSE